MRGCAVLLALLLLTLTSGLASGSPDDAQCLACHAKGSRAVSPAELKSSVHAALACAKCHADMAKLPHGKAKPVECSACHKKESTGGYMDSVHGKAAARGEKDVPGCRNCHGSHAIFAPANPGSMVHRTRIPDMCARCHEDQRMLERHKISDRGSVEKYRKSVHGLAFTEKGLVVSALCTDCHGIHLVKPLGKTDIAGVCGRCHEGILMKYRISIHGKALEKGVKDSPTCTDCHGEHAIKSRTDASSSVSAKEIPNTCSRCHGEESLERKYGLAVERFNTYMNSFHGVAWRYGDVKVANCGSCHGYHDILPSSNPRSMINKANLPKTCGKCHPGAGENFAKGSIHLQVGKSSDRGVFYIRNFYIVFISVLAGLFIIYVILDAARRSKRRKGTG